MKIAIIGGGPAGLLASWEFCQLGAEVVLFGGKGLGGGIKRLSTMAPSLSMEYPLDKLLPSSLLEGSKDVHAPTVEEYWNNYLEPLGRKIQNLIRVKNVRVLRVHKSFLGTDEIPEGRSRLIDLFRVVWFQEGLETYEDFDIAIKAEGYFHRPLAAGPGGFLALNEARREEEGVVSKSWDITGYIGRLSGKERVLLVGSGVSAAFFCRQFFSRFPDGKLDLVTTEKEPFEKMGKEERGSSLFKWVQTHMDKSYQHWKECRREGLPPDFCIYNGYNVVSIDKLEDRNNLFVTIEAPAFRREREGIKTLSVEGVLVATGFRHVPQSEEPGFYRLDGDIPQVLGQIQWIKKDVLSFFSLNKSQIGDEKARGRSQ